jgi:hypothetical protein
MPVEAPACLPVDCGDAVPDRVQYGVAVEYRWDPLQTVGPTRYLARAVYKCNSGFALPAGVDEFTRSCTAARQWAPAAPTCVDIDECDPTAYSGKYFVDCAALNGAQSRCINTFGGHVCTPFIDVSAAEPSAEVNAQGTAAYMPATRELVPNSSFGGQIVRFAVRGGVGLAAPFISQVRYGNPNETLYANPSLLVFPCEDVRLEWATPAQNTAAGFQHFFVSCTLAPGQGADLYLRLQYCYQADAAVGGAATVSCDNWNWAWTGKLADADELSRLGRSLLRVSYPPPSFVPASIHAITAAGVTQRSDSYVAGSTVGDDIGFDVLNLYVGRPELVEVTYGRGATSDDYPYACVFNVELTQTYGGRFVLICRTQNGLSETDLKFRLRLAGRTAYTSDTYSYPQVPAVDRVYGCAIGDPVKGTTSGCPTSGGNVRLTVTGTGFLEPLTVMIAGRQCNDLRRANNTYFSCVLPLGTGVALSLIVKSGSQRTEERDRISYAVPVVKSISGCERVSPLAIRQCSRLGGNRIQLTGTNFGISGATVSVGGVACTSVLHDNKTPHESLTCVIPEGSTQDRPVTLLQRYGEISRETVLLSYVQCEPGTYSDGIQCIECQPGSFNDLWSQSLCRPCQPGTFSNTTGATMCSECRTGTFSGLGEQACSLCSRGSFAQGRAESCTQCAPGTYAAREGSAQCETCPLGAEHTADYSYCQCKAGLYRTLTGDCTVCMLGGDCKQPGTSVFNIKSLPTFTPAISTRNRESVARVSMRLALPAQTADQQRAVRALVIKALFDGTELPRGRVDIAAVVSVSAGEETNFTDTVGPARVSPVGFRSSADSDDGSATSGPVAPELAADVFVDVTPVSDAGQPPAAAVAAQIAERLSSVLAPASPLNLGAVLVTAPTHDPLYSQFATQSFLQCINDACIGGSSCIEGHSGPLCTVCLPGYGKTGAFVCKKCNSPALRTAILVMAVVGAIVLCSVLVWKQIVDGRESMNELPAPAVPLLIKIATSGVQVMSIAARYDLRWPGFLEGFFEGADTAGGVGTAFLSLDCFLDQDPLIRPFWVTSIGIMVLPLLGVLLPLLVFVPRYIATKRVYRARVLAEVAQQRAMLVEMLDELKVFEKTRRHATRIARLAHERDNHNNGPRLRALWDDVDDRDETGIAAAAQSFEISDPANKLNGINLDAKDSTAALTASGAGAAATNKRRRLRRVTERQKKPLAPPVTPPYPHISSVSGQPVIGLGTSSDNSARAPMSLFAQRTRTAAAAVAEPSASRAGVFSSLARTVGRDSGRDSAHGFRMVVTPPDANPWAGGNHNSEDDDSAPYAFGGQTDSIFAAPQFESAHVAFADAGAGDASSTDEELAPALPGASSADTAAEFASAGDVDADARPFQTTADDNAAVAPAAVLRAFMARAPALLDQTDAETGDEVFFEADLASPIDDRDKQPTEAFFGDDFDLGSAELTGLAVDSSGDPEKAGLPGLVKHSGYISELVARFVAADGSVDEDGLKADAARRLAGAVTTEALAHVVQSVADLENWRILMGETFEVVSDAETLRDRLVRRERARDKLRQQHQLAWYQEQYGEDSGKQLFDENLKRMQESRTLRLTAGELRLRVDSAEMTYNQIVTEFMGYWITAITVVMFMIHPSITRQFFMVLTCKTVGDLDDPGASFQLGDMTEPCYSPQHTLFILALGIPMVLLWVLGIPLFAFIVLYRNSHLIQLPAVGVSTIMRVKKRNFEAQMAFLYRGYRPSRYYWFLVEMLKKVILVGISVFFPGALHTQLLMASLLIFLCIIAQIAAKPFENKVPEFAEFFSLFSSFMVFFLANFLFVDTVSESSKVVVTIMICIAALSFLVVVIASVAVLTKEDLALAPLRKRLQIAHASGVDTTEVLREWRREQLALRRARADSSGKKAGDENGAAGETRAEVRSDTVLVTTGRDTRDQYQKLFGEFTLPRDASHVVQRAAAGDNIGSRFTAAAAKINAGEDIGTHPTEAATNTGVEPTTEVTAIFREAVSQVQRGGAAVLEDELIAKIELGGAPKTSQQDPF